MHQIGCLIKNEKDVHYVTRNLQYQEEGTIAVDVAKLFVKVSISFY